MIPKLDLIKLLGIFSFNVIQFDLIMEDVYCQLIWAGAHIKKEQSNTLNKLKNITLARARAVE